ncbi:TetR family transcriptional regulator [Solirubrobacter sp. CPCC 204708]|uniref:TetR/AcrR family transcriptional regulator n=1 Tax=Solirubrobacter deserti TaxID=2282478 RepID=A0ABT4RCA9_9ACTN|nr:TetR/AcrR family transcriptional regulator [Solirubrobacter deserti]MBE2315530.1 TetR family transcriptional regulator [Solirubrobacter deserti]MDA0136169.1 TetR/AcrR family transcriptional regulator [Solirubrobacter deserti]
MAARREKYDRRQREVVSIAAALFARRGFQATSMDELSEATGLRSGGLYHYIGSKRALLLQIFSELMDPLLEQAAAIDSGTPEQQLRELVRVWVRHIEAHLDHMAVFAQERHAIEREPEWEAVRASRDAFEAILASKLRANGITDRLQHFALLGMVNHTATWVNPNGRLSADQIADGYCDMILK